MELSKSQQQRLKRIKEEYMYHAVLLFRKREYERLRRARAKLDPVLKEHLKKIQKKSYNKEAAVRRAAINKAKRKLDPILSAKDKLAAKAYEQRVKERRKNQKKIYYASDSYKKQISEYRKNKYYSKPSYCMGERIRARLRIALKNQLVKKDNKSFDLLGCSLDFYVIYLERKFKPGMTWENRELWHIDHIIPCASFDLTKKSEQRKCFNYTNTQPLWADENLKKHSKLITAKVRLA